MKTEKNRMRPRIKNVQKCGSTLRKKKVDPICISRIYTMRNNLRQSNYLITGNIRRTSAFLTHCCKFLSN